MEKKQIKINGKIAVEIKINGGLFWKAVGPEPTEPNKLVYSANAAGSTITVNGETVTLEQGDNITLDYPNEITSVKATNNTALTYIQIPNTVTSIEDGNYDTGSFYKCTALASVSLPDTMTMIGNYAFSGCAALASVTLPDSLTSIGSFAFSGCNKLVDITIPDSVKSIGNGAFADCSALASVTLPNTLVSIGDSAFSSCSSLVSITIPEGVTSIGLQAFSNCTALASVTLPNTLVSIGKRAFANCSALTDFNYNGTMSQWSAITLGKQWKYNAAFTVVHCTDGDVSI